MSFPVASTALQNKTSKAPFSALNHKPMLIGNLPLEVPVNKDHITFKTRVQLMESSGYAFKNSPPNHSLSLAPVNLLRKQFKFLKGS